MNDKLTKVSNWIICLCTETACTLAYHGKFTNALLLLGDERSHHFVDKLVHCTRIGTLCAFDLLEIACASCI